MDLAAAATGTFTPTDLHARLARLAGRWTGDAKTYADPEHPERGESARWDGSIAVLLGGRFVRFTYASRAMGQPIAGDLTIAFEKDERLVRMSWIDSLHTNGAILVSVSQPVAEDAAPPTIDALGSYFVGAGQPRWGWRTELDDRAEGVLRIRMFNVTPDGEESLGVAIDLTRAG